MFLAVAGLILVSGVLVAAALFTLRTQEIESGYIVRFRDLRYFDPNSTRRDILGASVELDRSLNVVREGFGSRGRKP